MRGLNGLLKALEARLTGERTNKSQRRESSCELGQQNLQMFFDVGQSLMAAFLATGHNCNAEQIRKDMQDIANAGQGNIWTQAGLAADGLPLQNVSADFRFILLVASVLESTADGLKAMVERGLDAMTNKLESDGQIQNKKHTVNLFPESNDRTNHALRLLDGMLNRFSQSSLGVNFTMTTECPCPACTADREAAKAKQPVNIPVNATTEGSPAIPEPAGQSQ